MGDRGALGHSTGLMIPISATDAEATITQAGTSGKDKKDVS